MTYSVHYEGDDMTWRRWLPTFLAFPLGGLIAVETIGSIDGPLTAAAAGALAGAIIGTGQWLALRSRGIDRRWIAYTAAAMSAGSAAAAALTGAGTEAPDLMLAGAVTGAAVGAAQSPLLTRGRATEAAWATAVAVAWALGWLATSSIGVDVERGYVVFGSAGAVLVTVLTGLALRHIPSAAA
jgi:hypothetical protein